MRPPKTVVRARRWEGAGIVRARSTRAGCRLSPAATQATCGRWRLRRRKTHSSRSTHKSMTRHFLRTRTTGGPVTTMEPAIAPRPQEASQSASTPAPASQAETLPTSTSLGPDRWSARTALIATRILALFRTCSHHLVLIGEGTDLRDFAIDSVHEKLLYFWLFLKRRFVDNISDCGWRQPSVPVALVLWIHTLNVFFSVCPVFVYSRARALQCMQNLNIHTQDLILADDQRQMKIS